MKLSSYTIEKNILKILIGSFVFFGFSFFAQAQVSTEALNIGDIEQFDSYSFYGGNSTPGICLLATFYTTQPASVQVRTAPFSTISNPVWTYSPMVIPIVPLTDAVNMQIGYGLQAGTEYIAQFVELAPDGTRHLITPSNPTDDIQVICTPNSDGTLNSSCPSNTVAVAECSPSGVNQAEQSGGDFANGVTITNVVSEENSLLFDINPNGLSSGEVLNVFYTTSSSNITNGTYQNGQSISVTVQGSAELAVNLVGLETNTTYYVTILNQSGSIVIDTNSNLPYETLATGNQTGTGSSNNTNGNGPGTINVNINSTFGQTELEGENIESGFTQCGYGDTYDCDFNQLLATIDRIIKFALYVIILPLAAILFAWSGIKLIIARAQGKQAALSDAKKMFGIVLLGLVFAMGAWVIVKFVLVVFGYTDASGLLTQILGITTE